MDIYQISLECSYCDTESKTMLIPDAKELQCQCCGRTVARIKKFEGVVYVMSNPHIRGVKVGRTTIDVYERAKQLSQTGVPGTYQVDAVFPSHRPKNDEAKAHLKLGRWKIATEHFNLSPVEAIVKIRSALQGKEPAFVDDKWQAAVSDIIERNRLEVRQRLGKMPSTIEA